MLYKALTTIVIQLFFLCKFHYLYSIQEYVFLQELNSYLFRCYKFRLLHFVLKY